MRRTDLALAVGALLGCGSPPLRAEDQAKPFSGEIAVVTDYVYRGISFSDGKPAIQATAEWSNVGARQLPGLHIGGWVSSIDFGPGDPANAEVWTYLGYQGSAGALNYDAGIVYTTYPGAPASLHYGYFETYASLSRSLGPASVSATVHFTPRYSGATGHAVFTDLEGELPLTEFLKATAALGYADVRPAAGQKYAYWSAGLAATWRGFTVALRYHGNDLAVCAEPCGDRVVLSLSRAF